MDGLRSKAVDEKFCSECGSIIKLKAEICPKCGVRQMASQIGIGFGQIAPNGKSRIVAALLAFFLGGIGVHKFYLGQIGWGIVYILFCLTFIPAIIALIESILFFIMSDEDFNSRYGEHWSEETSETLKANDPAAPFIKEEDTPVAPTVKEIVPEYSDEDQPDPWSIKPERNELIKGVSAQEEDKTSNKIIWGVLALFVILAIIISSYDTSTTGQNQSSTAAPTNVKKSYVSDSFICKAATAEHMGRSVDTMSVVKSGSKYHVTYIRPSDRTRWGVYCWVSGNRVLWQTDGSNGTGSNSLPGRVRDGQWDEYITYAADPSNLTIHIRYSDGSKTSTAYSISKGN